MPFSEVAEGEGRRSTGCLRRAQKVSHAVVTGSLRGLASVARTAPPEVEPVICGDPSKFGEVSRESVHHGGGVVSGAAEKTCGR